MLEKFLSSIFLKLQKAAALAFALFMAKRHGAVDQVVETRNKSDALRKKKRDEWDRINQKPLDDLDNILDELRADSSPREDGISGNAAVSRPSPSGTKGYKKIYNESSSCQISSEFKKHFHIWLGDLNNLKKTEK